jgi:Predicted 3'-5' exonuclease related to the exonuclease domain of PolB
MEEIAMFAQATRNNVDGAAINAPSTLDQAHAPAQWLVLDLETGHAPQAAIDAAMAAWKPPANIKDPEKIEARRKEAMTKIREKSALLDAAPIICVAMMTDRERVVFSGMGKSEFQIDDWQVYHSDDERVMLLELRSWLDGVTTPETTIVGHGVRGFDLPKLRSAYVRHRLQLPGILQPKVGDEPGNPMVDTMSLYRAFSVENRDNYFCSLDETARGLGIESGKPIISGKDVPDLHARGETETILTYCCLDVATTGCAFHLMTGAAGDLE